MSKILIKKVTNGALIVLVSAFCLVSGFSAVYAQSSSDIIVDIKDAITFCKEELPDGAPDLKNMECAFTKAGADTPCRVTLNPAKPTTNDSCNTYNLDQMIGRSKTELKDEAIRGGGQSSGGNLGSGSTELDTRLKDIINLLSVIIGLAVVMSIIAGGIQYITAGSNASQVGAAKNRIAMSVLALVLFMFGYTFLQWLIPGGIF